MRTQPTKEKWNNSNFHNYQPMQRVPYLIQQQQIKIPLPLLRQVSLDTKRQKLKSYLLIFTLIPLLFSILTFLSQGYIAIFDMTITIYLSVFLGQFLGKYEKVFSKPKKIENKDQSQKQPIGQSVLKSLGSIIALPLVFGLGMGTALIFLAVSLLAAVFTMITQRYYLKIVFMLITLAMSIISGYLFIKSQQLCQEMLEQNSLQRKLKKKYG